MLPPSVSSPLISSTPGPNVSQTITYYTIDDVAVVDNGASKNIFKNVLLEISGSEYETDVPGGFKSTIGTIRVNIISASLVIASYPYDQTSIVVNSSVPAFPIPTNNIGLGYSVTYTEEYNPSFYFNLIESSSNSAEAFAALIPGENYYGVQLDSSSKYIAEIYAGDNKFNQLYLYDETSSLLLTSSWIIGSGSLELELTASSIYSLNIITSGSVCCTPTLNSIENLGYNALRFNYDIGSCGVFASMSVFQSTDQINWSVLASGASNSVIISDTGSYPVSTSYYRLVQYCDDGMDTYNSDPSNILSLIPSSLPNIPDFYYVDIVGRCSSGTITRGFVYSPDSGSTTLYAGTFNYTTTYQPITSFFVYSGSTLFINANPEYYFGEGYEGSFGPYCGCLNSYNAGYSLIISASTTIYINLDSSTGLSCC